MASKLFELPINLLILMALVTPAFALGRVDPNGCPTMRGRTTAHNGREIIYVRVHDWHITCLPEPQNKVRKSPR